MGFLDKIKQQATDVASTVVEKTQETAKLGQLQVALRNLKTEEKDAMAALGREVHRLHGEGRLSDEVSQLDSNVAAVNDVQTRISQKEAEIAEVKDEEAPGGPGETVEGEAEEVVDATGEPPSEESPKNPPTAM